MIKRFVYYTHKAHDYILDTPCTSLDFIEMLGDALSTEEIVDLLNEQDERITELESDSQWDDERLESIEGLLLEYESQLPQNLLKEFYEIKEGRGN